jgi:hypothetical protein
VGICCVVSHGCRLERICTCVHLLRASCVPRLLTQYASASNSVCFTKHEGVRRAWVQLGVRKRRCQLRMRLCRLSEGVAVACWLRGQLSRERKASAVAIAIVDCPSTSVPLPSLIDCTEYSVETAEEDQIQRQRLLSMPRTSKQFPRVEGFQSPGWITDVFPKLGNVSSCTYIHTRLVGLGASCGKGGRCGDSVVSVAEAQTPVRVHWDPEARADTCG